MYPKFIPPIENPVFGLFINNFFNYYESEIYKGINKAIKENNLDLITFVGRSFNSPHPCLNDNGKNNAYSLASKASIDCLITISTAIETYIINKKAYEFFKNYNQMPVICIGMPFYDIPGITVDNQNGIIKMFEHLVKIHKYKKIAFVKGPTNILDSITRFNTYKRCLDEYNLPFDENFVLQGSFYGINEEEIKQKIINNKNKIDAIICINDYVAIKIIEKINEYGIRVPEDIAVVGFDNVIESGFDKYSLTTINQPVFDIGYHSVKILLSMINDKKQIYYKKLECELIIRKSCGCINNEKKNIINYSAENKNGNDIDADNKLEINLNKNNLFKMDFRQFNIKLNNVINLTDFKEVIHYGLSLMKIKRCFIGLFNPDDKNQSNTILVFDNDKKNDFIKNVEYPSKDIIPGGIKNLIEKKNIFIYSLHYLEENLGYIVFEIDLNNINLSNILINEYGDLFESLSIEISHAINNIFFYNKTKVLLFNKSINNIEKKVIKDYAKKCCLPKKTGKEYYTRLIELMKIKKPFINFDLTLVKLAKMMGISRTHLSFIINVYSNQNFYDFINRFRIEEAKKLIFENYNKKLPILDIAYLSGFNTKSTFNRAFKRFTEMTPKKYKMILFRN